VWNWYQIRLNLVIIKNPHWQTIMILKFNPKDHAHLTQRRIKRLTKLFLHPLGLCHLEVKFDRLMVHCTEAWMVDSLMDDLDYLSETARIILGAQVISLYFAKEEVYRTAP
jgi:hypothetical protein